MAYVASSPRSDLDWTTTPSFLLARITLPPVTEARCPDLAGLPVSAFFQHIG
jgi:hypothetical protein